MLELSYEKLRRLAFIYMALPCLVFLLTFVRLYIALPCAIALIAAVYLAAFRHRNTTADSQAVSLSLKALFGVVLIMLVWSFLGGQGNLWFQTSDWGVRNAIYRDLITRPWPVIYADKGTALSYYIGHWLVPAALSKGIFKVAGLDFAWRAGNIILWLWTTLGLTLVALLLFVHFKLDSSKKRLAALVIFIFFSGMDVVGALLKDALGQALAPETLHLEWWAYGALQFSSLTTCLYWVFNQAVVPWIATMCFIEEKDSRNYVLIVSTTLLFGPFPALGLAFLMLIEFVSRLIIYVNGNSLRRQGLAFRALAYVKAHALSAQNLLVLFGWSLIAIAYFTSNAAFTNGAHSSVSSDGGPSIKLVVALLILDAGAYLALAWPTYRKKPLFYAICGLLMLCPFVRVGESYDFTMRVSIPAIFILMLMCTNILLADGESALKRSAKAKMLLILCLVIGSATPALEIYRGFYHTVTEQTIFLANDSVYSLDNIGRSINFESFDYQDTFFFKYLAQ